MEELKLLIEMVTNLPTLAVWVLVGYLVYKVAVIGSIYGLARFTVDKLHNWLVTEKSKTCVVDTGKIGCINADVGDLVRAQIRRLTSSNYIHESDVSKLRLAIDKISEMEREAQRVKNAAMQQASPLKENWPA